MSSNLGINLLAKMGGEENISKITHCATRLRPSFKNISKVDIEGIKETKGVMGVVENPNGFQIVIGTNVGEVYDDIIEASNLQKKEVVNSDDERDSNKDYKKQGWFNYFIEMVVAIFGPLLPLLAGSGLLRGFTILANQIGISPEKSATSVILTAAATAVFTFLPLLVAYTAAKRFKANPLIAAAIMGALILPIFQELMGGNAGTIVHYMGIPLPIFDYTSQVIPAIVATWLQSKLEHFMKRTVPSSLQMIVVPTVLLFIMVSLAAILIGPAGMYLSVGMAEFVNWLMGINTILSGAIIAAIWNILIMFGIHWAPNTMIVIPEIAKTGKSSIIAYSANANFGMAGAALAVFFKTKNKSLKNFSLTAITSVMLSGIVEPAIYGLGVKYRTPLITGCIGAALGGAFMGAFHVTGNAFVFGGLTTIPAFAGTTLWAYIVGLIISFFASLILQLLIGIKDIKE
ncbi:PTS transporter subunit EIIC [Pediococcus pentosaceus]|uniref:PTS transporter subunit EIIC n=1 Tax=Pediococcus pentosaceus TaxID=1255 RepID=UPI0018A145C3|nr:PTS transporter subunit EIIC [Pediococcus pentosaceus]MBF7138945.1 PTS transporter subunit EIIC [Pediococcus pentosaceus]